MKQYGIFYDKGREVSYRGINGNNLVKLNTPPFNSIKEAQQYINDNSDFSSGFNFIILKYWEYIKPRV